MLRGLEGPASPTQGCRSPDRPEPRSPPPHDEWAHAGVCGSRNAEVTGRLVLAQHPETQLTTGLRTWVQGSPQPEQVPSLPCAQAAHWLAGRAHPIERHAATLLPTNRPGIPHPTVCNSANASRGPSTDRCPHAGPPGCQVAGQVRANGGDKGCMARGGSQRGLGVEVGTGGDSFVDERGKKVPGWGTRGSPAAGWGGGSRRNLWGHLLLELCCPPLAIRATALCQASSPGVCILPGPASGHPGPSPVCKSPLGPQPAGAHRKPAFLVIEAGPAGVW